MGSGDSSGADGAHLNVVGVAAAFGEVDVGDGGDAEPVAGQVAQDGVACGIMRISRRDIERGFLPRGAIC